MGSKETSSIQPDQHYVAENISWYVCHIIHYLYTYMSCIYIYIYKFYVKCEIRMATLKYNVNLPSTCYSIFVPSWLSYDAMAPMLHAQLGCDFGVMEMFVRWAVLIANEIPLDMVSVFTGPRLHFSEVFFCSNSQRQGNFGRSQSHQLLGGEVCWDAQRGLYFEPT